MKKLKRSGRLVDMTHYLLQHPHQLVSLSYFSDRYQSAKSSISEDLTIVKDIFESQGFGSLLTIAGASGGVKYVPMVNDNEGQAFVNELCKKLEDEKRLLPGGYLYMMDILGSPRLMNEVGRLFAAVFSSQQIDAVMTVATKGIPLAYAIGTYLDVPVSIVRRDHRVTEGSMVSINYVSGSTKRIQTMSLARRSLEEGANVLIVDDFMKAGGTAKGMMDLLQEFHANVVGIGVLVEAEDAAAEKRLVDDYVSVTRLEEVNDKERLVKAVPGNVLEKLKEVKQ
ncbi:purine operon repressor, PurR [Alteribacillus persepolensis]|uniref:Purine operon repressor, PurR n=1 Tax=Alteribacillus persepolensis TaxID=568899 RepID=A0A1G8HZ50_9BACI|nr:pur operon repressor [Alteribacillus persepolensis]SDI11897.1 purine operon repressor, PurR [Alteribacillus persepolensis]